LGTYLAYLAVARHPAAHGALDGTAGETPGKARYGHGSERARWGMHQYSAHAGGPGQGGQV